MNRSSKLVCAIVILCLMIGQLSIAPIYGSPAKDVDHAIQDTAAYLLAAVQEPQVGSVGGEWAVIGLARSGYPVPQRYFDDYYKTVENYVISLKGDLHDKKYTEYSRIILALTAIGADPTHVGGYNLLTPLGDFDKTIWQGINGPIFALIALDSKNYAMPFNSTAKTKATREMYVDEILSRQLKDGGFALSGTVSDPDVTGMALQALAKYQDKKSVKAATDKALERLSKIQDNKGGYSSWGVKNSESTVQVLMALCELGIPINDSRFVKNGSTVVDDLLGYYAEGKGFQHAIDNSGVNGMSTEQAMYGLVNAERRSANKNSLYRMSDVIRKTPSTSNEEAGLPDKHKDIKAMPVLEAGKTFSDIANHLNRKAIEQLASRGIINGMTADTFAPNRTMTRAEFAAIVTKGLGLLPKATSVFTDVPKGGWYAGYVGTAFSYGIVRGTSKTTFSPGVTITKQEAAVMIASAAKLCGMDTNLSVAETRDMLAQFGDYTKTAEWARAALAFNFRENILSQDAFNIEPKVAITRAEIAEMLYRMLAATKLL
ncbi:S-layer homology domain-containing protein [Paenibacillus sp. CF384]|uniref:S-layer homology domain-containing protein n=1 Tax=Paenibacillus sp. CF384 TaxID=1884382 RepID=UPI000897CD83|nr:S-layer homology domain-containing protein [Paenibacillus sp. CF384]SDX81784.1 S-layer homology domain-containing protein [Paenibacillus sp. CF384]